MHTGLLVNEEMYDKIKDLFYAEEIQKNNKEYMKEVKEYAAKESVKSEVVSIPSVKEVPSTGMIMDAVNMSKSNVVHKEAMESAIINDQMKKYKAIAEAWKEAHTQKVRKFDKIGRNDPCPCGSIDENGKPKKFKNCCLNKKDWNILINKK